jgi:paraquat-inducible protein A
LRRTSGHSFDHIIALTLAAFVLLVVMCSTTLMSVETSGIRRKADLFSGPEELVRQNMGELAVVIVFVTVLAPLIRLVGMLYVLIRLHERTPPGHLRRIFAWAERLRPWSMLEVFVFGVFVAYVKLGDLVTIGLAAGVYALLTLTFVLIWMDSALDREAVWERLYRGNLRGGSPGPGAIGCETCGLVSVPRPDDPRCLRCESMLHERKPKSVARTWALAIAAAVLYIPATTIPSCR